MKFVKVVSTVGFCLFLGTVNPLSAQHGGEEQKGKAEQPAARQEQHAQAPQQQQQHAQQPQQQQPQQHAQQPQQQQRQQAPQQQRAQQPQQQQPQQQRQQAPQQQRAQQPQQQQQQRQQAPQQQRAQQPQQAPQQQRQQAPQQQRVQQPQQAPQQQRQQAPQQQRAQQPQQQQQQRQQAPQQQRAQQPQQQQQPPQRSQQQARIWQQQKGWLQQGASQGHATWQQNRAQNWSSDHRNWGQRGGYGGYYIPQVSYNLYFGSRHFFRLRTLPVMYMGYPRFQYGGYTFLLLDPYPEYWPETWYASDDIYIDYEDGYYLHDSRYPGISLAVTIEI